MPTDKEIEAATNALTEYDESCVGSVGDNKVAALLTLEAAEKSRWIPIEKLPDDYNGFILVKLAEAHLMLGNITSASVCNGVVHYVGSYFAFDAPVIVEFQFLPTMEKEND